MKNRYKCLQEECRRRRKKMIGPLNQAVNKDRQETEAEMLTVRVSEGSKSGKKEPSTGADEWKERRIHRRQ